MYSSFYMVISQLELRNFVYVFTMGMNSVTMYMQWSCATAVAMTTSPIVFISVG